jgi:multicomponent Na+:H+ antiporter subunit F
VSILAGGLLGLAVSLIVTALFTLRSAADRMVAVDALSACVIAACLLAAARSGHTAFLDVALGFALVAFLGTVSWANALTARSAKEDDS